MSSEQKIRAALDANDFKAAFAEADKGIHDKFTQIEDQILHLQQKSTGAGGFAMKAHRKPLSHVNQSEGFKSFQNGARSSGQIDLALSVKALTSLQGSTSSPAEGIDVQSERAIGLYGNPLRPLSLFDVLPSRPISSNALSFTRMQNFVNAADVQSGEGSLKAEQEITPQLVTAPVATVAVHHTASKQVLEDEPGLLLTLTQLLQHGALDAAERQIISGAGGSFEISGLATEATVFVPTVSPMADRIGQCLAYMSNSGYAPDLVLVNPLDWFSIRAERSISTDEYIGPGWNAPTVQTVYGAKVVASAAVTAGTALCVDSRFVSLLDRQQATVELSREDGDNFRRNLITLLAELRVGCAVFDGKAVQSIDLLSTV